MTPQLLSMKVDNIHITSISEFSNIKSLYKKQVFRECQILQSPPQYIYINESKGCQKLILFAFSYIVYS